MRTIAMLAAAALVAGCANMEDLRAKRPVFTATTEKSPESYAGCVVEAWRKQNVNPSYSPVPGGAEVVMIGTQPDIVLRAMKAAHGSSEVRLSSRLPYGYDDFVAAARSCI